MLKHKFRFLLWSCVLLLSAALAVSYWVVSLFNQLDMVTAKRVLSKPARFYSDVLPVRAGQVMSPEAMEVRLRDRGYKLLKEGELAEGYYRFSSGGAAIAAQYIEVFFRPFIAPDGRGIAGLYRFVFSYGRLSAIEQFPSGAVNEEVILEPVELGDTRAGGPEMRPWARLNSIPDYLKAAVLDSEDKRFYSHPGVDPIGILRAFFVNIANLGVRQGGSTLTQQLVRNAFLSQKRTLGRKITEAALALIIEFRYDKDRIFELYLNQIYLGKSGLHTVYGVEDAALSYFGKHAGSLTLSESAMIAGIIPSPGRNNPRADPLNALERRNVVINTLLRNKRIDYDQAREAMREPLSYIPLTGLKTGSYYIDFTRQQIEAELGMDAMETTGLKIYTAMDPELEKAAEKALSSREYEGAVVAIDPHSGYVRALAGGRDFAKSPFNRAVLAKRSPGSAFKPLIFAAGLELKFFKPDTVIDDSPVRIQTAGKYWEPQNYDGLYLGNVTYADALVFSRNIPAVKVLQKVGPAYIASFARAMGLQSEMNIVPSLALGTSEVTPLEMTAAYAPFANGGFSVKPVFIRWVSDASGRVIRENKPELKRVISSKTAAQITRMLQDAVDRGTGKNVRRLGYAGPAAGKTGTSDYFHDGWFIGYTPAVLCGVWLGNDQPSPLGSAASETAVPVWTEFVKNIPPPDEGSRFGRKYPSGVRGLFMRLFGK